MTLNEADPQPYFEIIHAMLRHDGSEEEIARTDLVMGWMLRSRDRLDKVLTIAEMLLLGSIWKPWSQEGHTPTRLTLAMILNDLSHPANGVALLEGYDKVKEQLNIFTHADMGVILARREAAASKLRVSRILLSGQAICDGSIPNVGKDKGKKSYLSGAEDASDFVMGELYKKSIFGTDSSLSGKLAENTSVLPGNYSRNVEVAQGGRKFIPSGISLIDDHTGGLRRKEFNAVLGYTGQRKTAILRTMGYAAAADGFRVLHITLESDYEEELIAYLVMHSHAREWGTSAAKVSRSDFEEGALTPEQSDHLLGPVREHFDQTVGQMVTVHEPEGNRTWANVRAFIERECKLEPVDLVLIDYLTMLEPDPEIRDRMVAMTQMIQDVKRLCMKANQGDGLCLVTPVQGNRAGFKEASQNDGAWEVTGISLYSEMDKSLDNCFYVYMTDDMGRMNSIKFGSCKMRRNQNIPPSFLVVNQRAGTVEAPTRQPPFLEQSGSAHKRAFKKLSKKLTVAPPAREVLLPEIDDEPWAF